MRMPIDLLVDTLSGDRYEVHLVRYEAEKNPTQPALRLWATAEHCNFASGLFIYLQRDHSDSRETISKITIEGKTVDAEAARRSDEDWTRAIRLTLFLLSIAERRHRPTTDHAQTP